VIVRDAAPADIPTITTIYAHHVLNGAGTFEEVPPDQAEMSGRVTEVQGRGLPWLVAEDAAGQVQGYAYAGLFRTRTAYRYSAEDSVYVAPTAQGRGVGRALLRAVIEVCTAAGYCQMLALIGDSENAASIALHKSLGFAPVGVFRDVGFKMDRWLDVVMMQKTLAENQR
jgi:L-amino acid N-acyltransferase YncA